MSAHLNGFLRGLINLFSPEEVVDSRKDALIIMQAAMLGIFTMNDFYLIGTRSIAKHLFHGERIAIRNNAVGMLTMTDVTNNIQYGCMWIDVL